MKTCRHQSRSAFEGGSVFLISAIVALALMWTPCSVRAGQNAADSALAVIRPEAIRADMRFLADDMLEGRQTGTRGHEIAARFMASEFEAMGLEPAGENGSYYQDVPLRATRPDTAHTTLTLVQGGKEQALTFRRDFIAYGDPGRADTSVEAPVVYVGFGVTAPEQGYDDYAGVDAKGKIVALLSGAPPQFESTVRAYYSARETKAPNAVAHGAVGAIVLDSPALEQLYPFTDRVNDLALPDMSWLDAQGHPNDYFPELVAGVVFNMEASSRVLASSGKSPEEIYAAAKAGKPLSFALPVTTKIRLASRLEDIHSRNVVARLSGSDPTLRDQYVVYTAHLDHLGIGEPVNGDQIYNGALDNASGSACLLEIARAYSQMKQRPRRSILFVSVAGEEEGLLGSEYFAHHPTVPHDSLVADINMDGAALLWPIEDVVVRGAEHSTLAADVNEAAARLNLGVAADPHPEQVLFIRSDQFSFVRQGIPSVFPAAGPKSSDPNIKPDEIRMNWFRTTYHKPNDDMSQPFNFESGAKFARFNFLLGYAVAQQNDRPAWNRGDFFGERYGRHKN
jgi:hypothetical protein